MPGIGVFCCRVLSKACQPSVQRLGWDKAWTTSAIVPLGEFFVNALDGSCEFGFLVTLYGTAGKVFSVSCLQHIRKHNKKKKKGKNVLHPTWYV